MQPEPSTFTPIESAPHTAPEHNNDSKHGIRDDDQPAPPLLHEEERRRPRTRVAGHGLLSPSSSPESVDRNGNEAARLSPNERTPSPRNRIQEYEDSVAHSARKKSEGYTFEVIKKLRTPDDQRSPISKVPNGTLLCYRYTQQRIGSQLMPAQRS
jgi:hypothetical protein